MQESLFVFWTLLKAGLVTLVLCHPAFGESDEGVPVTVPIVETASMSEILSSADERTIFLLDLDDTLVRSPQHIGSDRWFEQHLRQLIDTGNSQDSALSIARQLYIDIREFAGSSVIESNISAMLHRAIGKGSLLVAVTARPYIPGYRDMTFQEIEKFGFPLSILSSSPVALTPKATLEGSVVFTGGSDKGQAVTALFARFQIQNRRVISVDDKVHNTLSMANAVRKLGHDVIAYRYTRMDQVPHLSPLAAALQLRSFLQKNSLIPTDADAVAGLRALDGFDEWQDQPSEKPVLSQSFELGELCQNLLGQTPELRALGHFWETRE